MEEVTNGEAEELRRQLANVQFPVSAAMRDDLRQRVAQYVGRLKELGFAPERVIVVVKLIAREAGLRPSHQVALVHSHMTSGDELLVELVGWCIEEYYGLAEPGCLE